MIRMAELSAVHPRSSAFARGAVGLMGGQAWLGQNGGGTITVRVTDPRTGRGMPGIDIERKVVEDPRDIDIIGTTDANGVWTDSFPERAAGTEIILTAKGAPGMAFEPSTEQLTLAPGANEVSFKLATPGVSSPGVWFWPLVAGAAIGAGAMYWFGPKRK